ncbi:MAG: cytochrome P460 family protein [Roseibium album]|uniref:Cytochrome P460 domain-containing protein n=1 Tax=Roseibium album TaxID=311410 RepID=A0A0M6ZW48_9HYPH|nr:cytochrome P460 family protein [Roseibium album]MBG6201494.1 hypothetical protein [Labrenzia sp. EL_13]MBG6207511.1 hypothetical protein [Labrenzia sp. EL_126]CTQ58450.1 hypothetical protein LA5094_01210 [Roseibium album]CTQ66497.1 hypothetical protein LA5096_01121 [Roseibium album]CTQ71588.1 hypothetical protein LA5095_02265 [Roseibium album]
MRKLPVWLGGAIASLVFTTSAYAACDVNKPGYELTGDEAEAVYDCLKSDLQAGYQKGSKRWIPEAFVKDYPGWTKASAFPAAPGFHGGRFLVTYVNSIGADEYLKYKPENVSIPAGTQIAKESFAIDDDGKVTKGPLFLMEKVAAGKSPKTDDWYYMMVAPNGSPQAVNVFTACSECHLENFGEQGGLGYPVEDARIK